MIFLSRFTPNATGDQVGLSIGEIVKYRLLNGDIIDAVIDSNIMHNKSCQNLGYESITLDDNERYFIDGKRIVWWDGKCGTVNKK